jgi:hypothetical protein
VRVYPIAVARTQRLGSLMEMSEIEREAILAERKEEQQKMEDQRQVAAMLQARNAGAGGDSVSKAAKRAWSYPSLFHLLTSF